MISFKKLGEWCAAEFVYRALVEEAAAECRTLARHNGPCDEDYAQPYRVRAKNWKCSGCVDAREHFWSVYSLDPGLYLLALEIVQAAAGETRLSLAF
jgi:hypothetical protein